MLYLFAGHIPDHQLDEPFVRGPRLPVLAIDQVDRRPIARLHLVISHQALTPQAQAIPQPLSLLIQIIQLLQLFLARYFPVTVLQPAQAQQ